MKTILTMLLALAAIITLPAPQAEAQSAPPQIGHLRAHGNGAVHLKASGKVEFMLHGKGVLVIQDSAAHKIKLLGTGKVTQTTEGDLVIMGFQGKVQIKGKGIKADFSKGRVSLSADGKGVARLKGKGKFMANGVSGKWVKPGNPPSPVSW